MKRLRKRKWSTQTLLWKCWSYTTQLVLKKLKRKTEKEPRQVRTAMAQITKKHIFILIIYEESEEIKREINKNQDQESFWY